MCGLAKIRFSKKGRAYYISNLLAVILYVGTIWVPITLWYTMVAESFDLEHIAPLSSIQAEWLEPFFVEIYTAENCADDEVLFVRKYDVRLPSTRFASGDYEISLT